MGPPRVLRAVHTEPTEIKNYSLDFPPLDLVLELRFLLRISTCYDFLYLPVSSIFGSRVFPVTLLFCQIEEEF